MGRIECGKMAHNRGFSLPLQEIISATKYWKSFARKVNAVSQRQQLVQLAEHNRHATNYKTLRKKTLASQIYKVRNRYGNIWSHIC